MAWKWKLLTEASIGGPQKTTEESLARVEHTSDFMVLPLVGDVDNRSEWKKLKPVSKLFVIGREQQKIVYFTQNRRPTFLEHVTNPLRYVN